MTGATDFAVVSMTAPSVSRCNLTGDVKFASADICAFSAGLLSFFLPCYQFGKNAEAVGENCILCGLLLLGMYWFGLWPFWTAFLRCHIRGKIREQKGIDVSDRCPGTAEGYQ